MPTYAGAVAVQLEADSTAHASALIHAALADVCSAAMVFTLREEQ